MKKDLIAGGMDTIATSADILGGGMDTIARRKIFMHRSIEVEERLFEIVGVNREERFSDVIAMIYCKDIEEAVKYGKYIITLRKSDRPCSEYWVCRGSFDALYLEEVNEDVDTVRRIQ